MTMLSPKTLLLGVSFTILTSPLSSAAITITVNSSAKTLEFSGSDTGSSFDIAGAGIFQVATFAFGAGSGTNESVELGLAFDESFTDKAELTVYDGTLEDGVRVVFSNSGNPTNASFSTLTTNSTAISYASLSPSYIAILESFGNETLQLDQGSGFSDITFSGTNVPEPSSVSLFVAGLTMASMRRRR